MMNIAYGSIYNTCLGYNLFIKTQYMHYYIGYIGLGGLQLAAILVDIAKHVHNSTII